MDRSLSARVADIRGRLGADSPDVVGPDVVGPGATPRAGGREKGGREKGGRERTAPGRPPARRRRRLISPLTRRILTLNVLVLMIPVLGLLHLDQYRQSLIDAELDALRTQGRAFALSLGSTAVVGTQFGDERLLPEMARHLMRVLLIDSGLRARIFGRSGKLVADSFVLVGPGGLVQVIELPPPPGGSIGAVIERFLDRAFNWLPFVGDLPVYREARVQHATHYWEVERALAGESPGMVRVDRRGRLVLSVGVPVQRYRQVLGALMLSSDGADVESAVRSRRLDILVVFAVAFAVTILLSIYLAGTIARPIRQLAEAADRVRSGKGRRVEIPDFRRRRDEIGDLSGALRDMTEALWTRLDAIESFAADVAHEIKNPLTSLRSAVETVSRVEDPEQQKKLMSIILDDVQRLDRLISDISDASRLDAELSRALTETVDVGRLLGVLVEARQASAAETGPQLRLEMREFGGLVVQGIADRLGQVLRNLIDNAVTFSPPDGIIDLAAWREDSWVVITVSDQGPGIPDGKLSAIFDRFYSERPETEKFGTHSGLGLSISKQIVEAHGGSIHAENRRDGTGKTTGARFVIRLPAE
ncbi:MAG: stimulus-sensing domain-containing protein [Proteobacteria bacterium]|nr:stimulus-sensing domain-containing protein [Pseudomonadota bacterium]